MYLYVKCSDQNQKGDIVEKHSAQCNEALIEIIKSPWDTFHCCSKYLSPLCTLGYLWTDATKTAQLESPTPLFFCKRSQFSWTSDDIRFGKKVNKSPVIDGVAADAMATENP